MLKEAKDIGLPSDIAVYPYRGKTASAQVDELMKKIRGDLYTTVWIKVVNNPTKGYHIWQSNTLFKHFYFIYTLG